MITLNPPSYTFRSARPFSLFTSILLLVVVASMLGCTRVPPLNAQGAFREITAPELKDDLDLAGLVDSIQVELEVLKGSPQRTMQFGAESFTREKYAEALERLVTQLSGSQSTRQKLDYIQSHFRFFEFFGTTEWGKVLLTSYFEPVITGSRVRTRQLSRALLSQPKDLLTIPLSPFAERFAQEKALKGRLQGSTIIPYYSREEIDGKAILKDQKLELVWTDPIDGFFLQIQGSGTVAYADGTEDHLVYADKNGHRYEAIGKFLKDRIAPYPVTMQRIESLLRSLPSDQRDAILFKNPSYVFFNKSAKRAITSLGVPATPGRTIATDAQFAPKGAVAFLQFSKPVFTEGTVKEDLDPHFVETSRFVVDQDTGGAITGTGRVDLFWGRGDEAKRSAGLIQHPARLVYLAPK